VIPHHQWITRTAQEASASLALARQRAQAAGVEEEEELPPQKTVGPRAAASKKNSADRKEAAKKETLKKKADRRETAQAEKARVKQATQITPPATIEKPMPVVSHPIALPELTKHLPSMKAAEARMLADQARLAKSPKSQKTKR